MFILGAVCIASTRLLGACGLYAQPMPTPDPSNDMQPLSTSSGSDPASSGTSSEPGSSGRTAQGGSGGEASGATTTSSTGASAGQMSFSGSLASESGAGQSTGAMATGAPAGGNVGDASAGATASGAAEGDASITAVPPTFKRGFGYGSNSTADLTALSKAVGWWYNWGPSPDGTLNGDYAGTGVEFVPMIWGGTVDVATLEKQIPAGSKYLLTFNEPNFGSQSNLTPAAAAALWPEVEQVASDLNLKIVGPSLNYCAGNCNETDPIVWLQQFFADCANCKMDYLGMHWYACSQDALTQHLALYEQFGYPIWLTEFSCLDTGTINAQVEQQYMTTALEALEGDPKVFRYAWFTGRYPTQPAVNLLGGTSGTLTSLGQQYVSMP